MGWDMTQTSHQGCRGSPYREKWEGGAVRAVHICLGGNLEQDESQGAFGRPNIGIFPRVLWIVFLEGLGTGMEEIR